MLGYWVQDSNFNHEWTHNLGMWCLCSLWTAMLSLCQPVTFHFLLNVLINESEETNNYRKSILIFEFMTHRKIYALCSAGWKYEQHFWNEQNDFNFSQVKQISQTQTCFFFNKMFFRFFLFKFYLMKLQIIHTNDFRLYHLILVLIFHQELRYLYFYY